VKGNVDPFEGTARGVRDNESPNKREAVLGKAAEAGFQDWALLADGIRGRMVDIQRVRNWGKFNWCLVYDGQGKEEGIRSGISAFKLDFGCLAWLGSSVFG